MVKRGGNGPNRGKYNQRGRQNGGGMNDFRNRSQQLSSGLRGQTNGGFGNGGNQRPTSRFSNAQNGNSSYQPRPYNGIAGNQSNQAPKPAYDQRSTPSSYPPKNGSYDVTAANGSMNQSRSSGEQSKYNSSASIIPNVYGQQSHQSYPSVMASGIPSIYSLPPPALSQYNAVQSVPFNYPPPVLPVKN